MRKMIQVRNVPDDLHRQLKARAARSGVSLSDLCLRELREAAAKPTLADWLEQVERLPPTGVTPEEIVALIRADRDGR